MTRRFLFLQGPHGPFFAALARALAAAGADCRRVLFNRGDRAFWPRSLPHVRYSGTSDTWPGFVASLIERYGATDLVLYGDTRPVHAAAIEAAEARGITVHVFEEGYLRPWWVTYERGGANGRSPVMRMTMDEIRAALDQPAAEPVEAPEGWGALYRHMAYGALYHACILTGGDRLPPHRDIGVGREALLHGARLLAAPVRALDRRAATWRLSRSAQPFHLVLLQLAHDASYRAFSPFPDTAAFLDTVFRGFASGAPQHHLLVLKSHPLEDGRVPLRPLVRTLAERHRIAGRVRFVGGGKLAHLLGRARSVVTVNSTAAQQALWRGLPVKAFGEAPYARAEFVSSQPMQAFFADPQPPDRARYADFRRFLLETSQFPGSYYTLSGRRQLCRRLPDIMLAEHDRYHRLRSPAGAAPPQHLSVTT